MKKTLATLAAAAALTGGYLYYSSTAAIDVQPRLSISRGRVTNLAGVKMYVEFAAMNQSFVNLTALTTDYVELKFPTATNANWVYRLQFKDKWNSEPPVLRTTNGAIITQLYPNPKYIQWTNSPMFKNGNGSNQSFFVPVPVTSRYWQICVTTN